MREPPEASPPRRPAGSGPLGPEGPRRGTGPLRAPPAAPSWRLDLGFWKGDPALGLQPAKLLGTAVAAWYTLSRMQDEDEGSLLYSSITFFVHEAGHMVFSPFGEFLTIAGGSIFQLLVPLAFVASFAFRGMPMSSALVLYWLAFSLRSVSIYAWDAIDMTLPLGIVGVTGQEEMEAHGETGHDWHNMLERLGLLGWTYPISGAIRHASTFVWALATYLCLLGSGLPLPSSLSWPWLRASGRKAKRTYPSPGPGKGPGRATKR